MDSRKDGVGEEIKIERRSRVTREEESGTCVHMELLR